MLEIFLVGSFWFWALIAVEIILLFMFVEWENGFGATASVLIFAAMLQFLGNVNIIGFITENPFQIVALVGAYFLLGAIWSICKWYLFCKDKLEEYEEAKTNFLIKKGLPENTKIVPVEYRAEWKNHLDHRSERLNQAPSVRTNKSKILRWMSFWPISLVWGIINDFVKRICKTIYARMASFLQRVSDNIFSKSNINEDTTVPEDLDA